jgi:TPR repeat protein
LRRRSSALRIIPRHTKVFRVWLPCFIRDFRRVYWVLGLLVTFEHWGMTGLFVGIIMGVVGVVPLGMLASAFHGIWPQVGDLALGLVLTFGARAIAILLAQRMDRDQAGIGPNSPRQREADENLLGPVQAASTVNAVSATDQAASSPNRLPLRLVLVPASVLGLLLLGSVVPWLADTHKTLVPPSTKVTADQIEEADTAYRKRDYATALRLIRPLADHGNAVSQTFLGAMYFNGDGVAQNYGEAAKWYRLAADRGNASAQDLLGSMYFDGKGVQQNYAEAAKWYRVAADRGNASAQNHLGSMYSNGKGVPRNDTEAVRWFRLAADLDNVAAQNNLGVAYENGLGVPRNSAEAARWYRFAADRGFVDAQFNLGQMYLAGPVEMQNSVEAVKWFRLAADRDNTPAQYFLAIMDADGKGVTKDYVSAYVWCNLASAKGDRIVGDVAVKLRDLVEQSLTPMQLAEAKKLSREWRSKPTGSGRGG